MTSSDWCKGSCDTLDDLSCSLCAFYKTEEVNLNAFKITFYWKIQSWPGVKHKDLYIFIYRNICI